MCPTKTDEPIDVSFGVCVQVDPRNRVLGGGLDPLTKGALL